METRITNIVVEWDCLKVFAIIHGNDEINVFAPEATLETIVDWVKSKKEYYISLEEKAKTLMTQILDIEL